MENEIKITTEGTVEESSTFSKEIINSTVEKTSDEVVKITPYREEEKLALDIKLTEQDALLMLNALVKYSESLEDNKRRVNSLVEDLGFNTKVDKIIKRSSELRFLIKKGLLVLDKDKEIYSIEEEGEVIGIETSKKTEVGITITEEKPLTVGDTPKIIKDDVKKEINVTVVQTVSEEL